MVDIDSISDLLCNIKEAMKPYFNTKPEITDMMLEKADADHDHDTRYFKQAVVEDKISFAIENHDHNNLYYGKTYVDDGLEGKADAIHTHPIDSAIIADSDNPVKNSTIKSALDGKANTQHDHNSASATNPGFMSKEMFNKLDGIQAEANKTIVDSSISSTSTNPVQNKVINTELNKKAGLDIATSDAKGLMSTAMVNKLASITEGAMAKKRTPGFYIASPKNTSNGGFINIDQGTKLRVCLYNPEKLSSFAVTGWDEAALITGTDIHYTINGQNRTVASGNSFTVGLSPATYDVIFIFHGSGNYYPIYRSIKLKVD